MRTRIPEYLANDPWIKVVEMLQQNWAVVLEDESPILVVFFDDRRGVFDELRFESLEKATTALKRNGFFKYQTDREVQEFIPLPEGDFHERAHWNGRIYSSGRFWR